MICLRAQDLTSLCFLAFKPLVRCHVTHSTIQPALIPTLTILNIHSNLMTHLFGSETSSAVHIFNRMQLFETHTGQTTRARHHLHLHLRLRRWGRNDPLAGAPGENLCVV